MMKHYEYAYLTRQEMAEDIANKLQDKLVASITAKNGTITDLPKAYKKRLAYRIQKQDAAYVNSILFQMEPAPLDEFKKEAALITEIIRGLVIAYDPEKLKREIRPEMGNEAARANDAVAEITAKPALEVAKPEPVKMTEIKVEEKPEVKIEQKEEKKEEKKEEPVAETPKEEEKNIAKPKRKTRVKAELRDIEQKLDEILK